MHGPFQDPKWDNLTMKRLSRIVVALSCLLSASGGQAQNLVCSSGKGGWQGTQVVVLRPSVKITDSSPGHFREGVSEQTETGFHGVLGRAFEDKGYKLWLDPMFMPAWEQAPKTDTVMKLLKDHFDSVLPKDPFEKRPDCKTLLKISFKNDLEGLTDREGSDALVLARAQAHRVIFNWADKIDDALTGAMTGGTRGELYMDIAIVDRGTGAILYYCESKASGTYVLEPDRLSPGIRKCLKRFPRAANQGSPSSTLELEDRILRSER